MHTFIITLRNSPRTKLALDHFNVFDLNPEVVYGVQGKMLDQEIIRKIYLQSPIFRNLTLGEIGCYLSHNLVFKNMVEKGISRAFVFEDDARFLRNPQELISSLLVTDFGTSNFNLNLYNELDPVRTLLRKRNKFFIGETAIQSINFPLTCTTAYFISLDYAMERLLHAFPIIRPIDIFGHLKLKSKCFIMHPTIICTVAVDSETGLKGRLVGSLLRRGTHIRFAIDYVADWITHRWMQRKFWPLDKTISLLASLNSYC